MSDGYTLRNKVIPFLKFVITSVWDDVHNPFSRLHVLEAGKHVLEKAFQLAKFGRRWVECYRAGAGRMLLHCDQDIYDTVMMKYALIEPVPCVRSAVVIRPITVVNRQEQGSG